MIPMYMRLDMPQGFVTKVMSPKERSPAGAVSRPVDPQKQAVVNRINKALASRVAFKLRMQVLWIKTTGPGGKADLKKLTKFIKIAARDLAVDVQIFGNIEAGMHVYDFDGSHSLTFNEAYRLVKHSLAKHRKELGGNPDIDVPHHTPEEGGFTFVKILGKGGQGTAALAKDPSGEDKVLKIYEKANTNAGTIDDLKEELEVTGEVHHNKHIAHTYEIFQDDMNFYLVQDAYMGGDFESIQERALAQGVQLTEDWYRDLFYQCFSALKFLHEHGIVHCDIKEANIMAKTADLDAPMVVIIDYGMASDSLMSAKGICGTPGYIPPETWDYGAWYPRGDVFSMGVVCVQMLTDNVPNAKKGRAGIFQRGSSIDDVIKCTKNVEPPFDKIHPYSDEILDWLESALEKEFFDRAKPMEILESDWFAPCRDDGGCHCIVS